MNTPDASSPSPPPEKLTYIPVWVTFWTYTKEPYGERLSYGARVNIPAGVLFYDLIRGQFKDLWDDRVKKDSYHHIPPHLVPFSVSIIAPVLVCFYLRRNLIIQEGCHNAVIVPTTQFISEVSHHSYIRSNGTLGRRTQFGEIMLPRFAALRLELDSSRASYFRRIPAHLWLSLRQFLADEDLQKISAHDALPTEIVPDELFVELHDSRKDS